MPGVADYLMIVSGYVERYRGRDSSFSVGPRGARFGAEKFTCAEEFIRVPSCRRGGNVHRSRSPAPLVRGDVPGLSG